MKPEWIIHPAVAGVVKVSGIIHIGHTQEYSLASLGFTTTKLDCKKLDTGGIHRYFTSRIANLLEIFLKYGTLYLTCI